MVLLLPSSYSSSIIRSRSIYYLLSQVEATDVTAIRALVEFLTINEIEMKSSYNQESNEPLQAKKEPTSLQTDDTWIGFSDLNKFYYTTFLGLFSVSSSFISHPFTVISVNQQVGNQHATEKKKDMFSIVKTSITMFGFRGLFRGFIPMAALGTPSNVVYFSIIEAGREVLQPALMKLNPNMPKEVVEVVQSGATSLVANVISLAPYVPAEVISSRIITSPSKTSILATCKNIYKETGIKGFFKGFGASFSVYVVSSVHWWTTYSFLRRYGMETERGKSNPIVVESIAGGISGLVAVTAAYPIDTIKTRIMTSTSATIPRFRDVFVGAIKRGGFRSLFRGLPASLYSAAIGSTIFACCYETIKENSQK